MNKIPPEIRILSDDVANKIAAGEVIERPAAVVKELLENSIDAGATRICIEFKHGGKSFIKIEDNGCGMTREQALMSLEAHATSKISSPDDLFKISSYGFRGEAMPSIASVSKFSMRTRPASQETGTLLDVFAGDVKSISECGMPEGTQMLVENLFCSVPARRKFMKSDAVEAGHIIKLCRLYALALPNLSITLIENAKVVFRSEPNLPVLRRIERIFGREISSKLIELKKCQLGNVSVSGAILMPGESFATSRNICSFINSRPIESKTVYSAIKEAYGSLIPKGRFAAAFLFIEMNPADVDVNVHPAKREVRLKNEFQVKDFLFEAISRKLEACTLSSTGLVWNNPDDKDIAQTSKIDSDLFAAFATQKDCIKKISAEHIDNGKQFASVASEILPQKTLLKPAIFPDSEHNSKKNLPRITHSPSVDFQSISSKNNSLDSEEFSKVSSISDVDSDPCDALDSEKVSDGNQVQKMRYIGSFKNKYILFESPKAVVLMSVSAALKRVTYERILKNLRGVKSPSQKLLLPINLKFERADAECFDLNKEAFEACGFEIENFGVNFYRVCSSPAWLGWSESESFIRDFIELARDEDKSLKKKKFSDEIFAKLVVQKTTLKGFTFNETSANSLLNELLSCSSHIISPDGKPTLKEIFSGF